MPFGNRKKYFRGSFHFGIVTIQKISPPRNLNFNYSGIFQSLKLRILMEKILSISLMLNLTPNTLGCYGLLMHSKTHISLVGKWLTIVCNASQKICRFFVLFFFSYLPHKKIIEGITQLFVDGIVVGNNGVILRVDVLLAKFKTSHGFKVPWISISITSSSRSLSFWYNCRTVYLEMFKYKRGKPLPKKNSCL